MDVQSPSNQLTDWQSTLQALEKLYSILSYLVNTSKKTHYFKIVRGAHYEYLLSTGSNELGTTTELTATTKNKGYFRN